MFLEQPIVLVCKSMSASGKPTYSVSDMIVGMIDFDEIFCYFNISLTKIDYHNLKKNTDVIVTKIGKIKLCQL